MLSATIVSDYNTGIALRGSIARQDAVRELLLLSRSLKGFAMKLCGSREQAEDLVQETYLKACRYLDRYEPGSNAKAWLFRILKNNFINQFRRKKRNPVQLGYEGAEPGGTSAPAYRLSAERAEQATHHWVGDEVSSALAKLPPDYRLVVLLCDLENFTYDEIAQIVGIPVGTVRSRLHRGRTILRRELATYALSRGYELEHAD